LNNKIPYFTTISAVYAGIEAIRTLQQSQLEVKSLQEYLEEVSH
jgi:hypothetical protein